MKKTYLAFLLIISLIFEIIGQTVTSRVVIPVSFPLEENIGVSITQDILLDNISPFLAYSISWEGSGEEIAIRFSADGLRWDDWQLLQLDPHANNQSLKKVSELGFNDLGIRYFQVQITKGTFEQLKGHFYNPGDSPEVIPQTSLPIKQGLLCTCDQPVFQGRSDWCPDGTCPPNPNPSTTDVTHLIVHHSAGTNVSSDWAAVVRSLYDYHINTLGYSDIGWNWLIDPNGVVYEGRGDDIVGSVFCATNSGTMGACLMGDFDLVEPSEEAKSALVELLAWKACASNIAPLETSYHTSSELTLENISGHIDGCNSLCPGEFLYQQLATIRSQVSDYIDSECNTVSTVKEFFNLSEVEIFPNPTEGSVAVHFTNDLFGEVSFQLFDLQGKIHGTLLTSEKSIIEQTFQLDTRPLLPGIYLLQILHKQKMISVKIVKQ